ncbi:MAG: hypothetical protein KBT00_03070 [Bacteroidales bacterium]|nr:hypothetical protein [Candidatus Cacconaster merdequi]
MLNPDGFEGELANSYANDAALADAGNLVFLPAAGYRKGSDVFSDGDEGYYWSSTALDEYDAYDVYFNGSSVGPGDDDTRSYGFSVRLITECQ